VHTEASLADMLSHLDLAVQRNAGGIYVTDDVLPNPWNRLPTYWSALVDAVAATNADYNSNGVVDAADYVVWRKTDGTQAGYNNWRSHFGQTAGSGSIANGTVPEPATCWLAILSATVMALTRRIVPHSSARTLDLAQRRSFVWIPNGMQSR
jgi:hypothetical protein